MKEKFEKLEIWLKVERNFHLSLVFVFIVLYFIVGMVFKSGYDLQDIYAIEREKKEPKVKELSYKVFINDKKFETKTLEKKSMQELILDADKSIEFRNYFGGKKLVSVGGKDKFEIYINDIKFNGDFLDDSTKLGDDSQIRIVTY